MYEFMYVSINVGIYVLMSCEEKKLTALAIV